MNNDERVLLTRLLDELAPASTGVKDREADEMIVGVLSSNPEAAYLLVQHAIVADQSLLAAQQRIAELESQQSGSSLNVARYRLPSITLFDPISRPLATRRPQTRKIAESGGTWAQAKRARLRFA